MIRIDYHTHHERCGHAKGSLQDYIEQAIAKGMTQLGLSDHMPLIHVDRDTYYPEVTMALEELPRYVEEAFELQAQYASQLDIRVGMEADYIEGFEESIQRLIESYPWDYIIGSVHFLGTWDLSDFRQQHEWAGKDIREVYEQYYDAICKAARSGMYDYIGHIDMIKRFGVVPEQSTADLETMALRAIQEAGIATELNTAGWRSDAKEQYPKREMLEQAYKLGIPLTIGSDAHTPLLIGKHFHEADQLLREVGYTKLATFKQRKLHLVNF